jgi:hypothetical protein
LDTHTLNGRIQETPFQSYKTRGKNEQTVDRSKEEEEEEEEEEEALLVQRLASQVRSTTRMWRKYQAFAAG